MTRPSLHGQIQQRENHSSNQQPRPPENHHRQARAAVVFPYPDCFFHPLTRPAHLSRGRSVAGPSPLPNGAQDHLAGKDADRAGKLPASPSVPHCSLSFFRNSSLSSSSISSPSMASSAEQPLSFILLRIRRSPCRHRRDPPAARAVHRPPPGKPVPASVPAHTPDRPHGSSDTPP